MKVPFLSGKITGEFNAYLEELGESVNLCVADAKTTNNKELFSSVYPLFVLLRALSNSDYARDPVRDIVLTELKSIDKRKFLEAVSFFQRGHKYQQEFRNGMQKQVFTGYFRELFSDALLLLNSYYTNNYRGSQIALRCMLEDLYRHLYYRDHPQEFVAIANNVSGEYEIGIRPKFLREYLKRADYLQIFNRINSNFEPKNIDQETIFDVNEKLYTDCSAAVHGSDQSELNAFQSNLDFHMVPKKTEDVLRMSKQFTNMAVSFLISAHHDQFLAFSEYERSLILSKFPEKNRAALRKALNI